MKDSRRPVVRRTEAAPAAADPPRTREASRAPLSAAIGGASQIVSDYVSLTKPRVQVLLLLTTVASMEVAGDPSVGRIGLTLIGGYLSAGGAGAVNHAYDRDIDARMPRTADRPVPAGRVSPRAALIYGVVLAILTMGYDTWVTALGYRGGMYHGVWAPVTPRVEDHAAEYVAAPNRVGGTRPFGWSVVKPAEPWMKRPRALGVLLDRSPSPLRDVLLRDVDGGFVAEGLVLSQTADGEAWVGTTREVTATEIAAIGPRRVVKRGQRVGGRRHDRVRAAPHRVPGRTRLDEDPTRRAGRARS